MDEGSRRCGVNEVLGGFGRERGRWVSEIGLGLDVCYVWSGLVLLTLLIFSGSARV